MAIPKYHELFNPVLQAIKRLGGSASNIELIEEVIRSLSLSDEDIAKTHDLRSSELEYRIAWAKSYLKKFGLLENSARGVWVLTQKGKELDTVDTTKVRQFVGRESRRKNNHQAKGGQHTSVSGDIAAAPDAVLEDSWRDELLSMLHGLHPNAFERLCQRLLRESGFVEVKVTGRSGDGGIDGVGIVRLGGLLGFPVLFQCKRYKGSVPSSAIRDFRGAMIGRADRGLVITTGTFSREAKVEATRDGAPPIDLVDGEQLLEKLKELRLGVNVEMIESVSILPDWFKVI
jgi:restriction system protein